MAYVDNPKHLRFSRGSRTGDRGSPANWTGAPRVSRSLPGPVYVQTVAWRRRLTRTVWLLVAACIAVAVFR